MVLDLSSHESLLAAQSMLKHIYGLETMTFLHDDLEDYREDPTPLHHMMALWDIGDRFKIGSLTAKVEARFRAMLAPDGTFQAVLNEGFWDNVAGVLYCDVGYSRRRGLKDILVENMADHFVEHCEDWYHSRVEEFPWLAYDIMHEQARRADRRAGRT